VTRGINNFQKKLKLKKNKKFKKNKKNSKKCGANTWNILTTVNTILMEWALLHILKNMD